MSRTVKLNYWLVFSASIIMVAAISSVWLEWRYPLHTTKYAWWQGTAWYISLLIFAKYQTLNLKRFFWAGWWLIFLGIIIHVLLNAFNVISLPNQSIINSLKIYRFLSISGFFWIFWGSWFSTLVFIAPEISKLFPTINNLYYKTVLWHFLAVVALVNCQLGLAQQYRDSLLAIMSAPTAFNQRLTFRLGGNTYYGWIQPYTQFITQLTPPDSFILLPPQSNVWKMEGNADYVRYFLYPRQLVIFPNQNWSDISQVPPQTQFILIAEGECGEGDCGWPKFPIPQSKISHIWEIIRPTGEIVEQPPQDFDPANWQHRWGLIELNQTALEAEPEPKSQSSAINRGTND